MFESYLSNLLWHRCSQNFFGWNNYFHHRQRTTSLSEETLFYLQFRFASFRRLVALEYSITQEQKFRMRIVRSHLNYIENLISKIDSEIDVIVAKHESLISLLCTIPGVDRNSAITIISEIGNDMSQFGSLRQKTDTS